MTESRPQAVAREFIDALGRGDTDAVNRLLADDVTWTFPGAFEFSGTHGGKEAVFERFLGPAGTLFEPPSAPPVELHNIVAQDAVVAIEYTTRMRTATGNDYENDYLMMVEVEGGHIKHVREYTDTSYLRSVCYR